MSWRKVLEDTSLLKISRKLKLSFMTVSVQPESLFTSTHSAGTKDLANASVPDILRIRIKLQIYAMSSKSNNMI